LAKQLSNNSIENFIINNNLNYELLTNYLKKTQKDKIYMLYNNNSFTLYKNNIDDLDNTEYRNLKSVMKN
jgi:hypothetical protein